MSLFRKERLAEVDAVDSTPGEGTCMRVCLRRRPPDADSRRSAVDEDATRG